MVFCENCFRDTEIISTIQNEGSIGDCPICRSRQVHLYDTEKQDSLSLLFDDLVSVYTPESVQEELVPDYAKTFLMDELRNNWNLFAGIGEKKEAEIVKSICSEQYDYNKDLFDKPVVIKELYDKQYLGEHSLLKQNTWSDFVDSLKSKNRYHTHLIDLKLLERYCSYVRKKYLKGTHFYRCRISSANGLPREEMSAPPVNDTTDGRANAKGIRCLYLGDSEDTTIYETRAGAYDYVTVGTFELNQDIVIVDFKGINQISPFLEGIDALEYAINKEHLNRINDEMSKIMRRSDSPLDYIPTQYITDFVKSITHKGEQEYAGIEYKSVMNPGGFNLAIFDPDVFSCISTKVYRIDSIDYEKREITTNKM